MSNFKVINMQINTVNTSNSKLMKNSKISFGSSSINNTNNFMPKADKTDVGIGITSALAYGGLLTYLGRNINDKNFARKPLTIINSLFAGFLATLASVAIRNKNKDKN